MSVGTNLSRHWKYPAGRRSANRPADGDWRVREDARRGSASQRGISIPRPTAGAFLYDVLGTVDASGNLVSTRKYDVYGAVRGSTGPSGTRHKFVGSLGHPSDSETGLIYMQAR